MDYIYTLGPFALLGRWVMSWTGSTHRKLPLFACCFVHYPSPLFSFPEVRSVILWHIFRYRRHGSYTAEAPSAGHLALLAAIPKPVLESSIPCIPDDTSVCRLRFSAPTIALFFPSHSGCNSAYAPAPNRSSRLVLCIEYPACLPSGAV